MNQIKKFKFILNKNNFFINSLKLRNYNIKNILINNKKSIIFASSLSFVGFSIFLNNKFSSNIFTNPKCAECALYTDKVGKTEWVNKPESVKLKDRLVVEEAIRQQQRKSAQEHHEHKNEEPKPISESDSKIVCSLPMEVPYIIIGGGVAGMSAARAIRASDPFAKVLIINSECQNPGVHKDVYPPYRRILLSKFIWRRTDEHQKTLLDTGGDVKNSSFLYIEPDTFFVQPEKLNQLEYGGISLMNNTRVESINPQESSITLEGSGHTIFYKACLIATGSRPRRLKHLEISENSDKDLFNDGKVSYFRSLNDFRNLYETIKKLKMKEGGGRILIVGCGLLGTELTSSLSRLAKEQGNLEVIQVFKEKSHLFHILPEELSNYVNLNIAKNEVKLLPQSEVVAIEEVISNDADHGRLNIVIKPLSSENEQKEGVMNEIVDHVVIAAGVKPETSLGENGNLEIDQMLDGYLVNAELQAREGIWVAGDVCSFYDGMLGRRRVEHWDHSEESGSIAGHNMAAFVLKTDDGDKLKRIDMSKLANNILKPKIYNYQSSFSFKLSLYKTFEAVGLIDSSLETKTFIATDFFEDSDIEDGEPVKQESAIVSQKKHHQLDMPGVVFYLRSKRIVGILLWNCDDDIVIDSDFPSPLRSNVARKILADRRLIGSQEELTKLAADFDLSFFVNSQIKYLDRYAKNKKEETDVEK